MKSTFFPLFYLFAIEGNKKRDYMSLLPPLFHIHLDLIIDCKDKSFFSLHKIFLIFFLVQNRVNERDRYSVTVVTVVLPLF